MMKKIKKFSKIFDENKNEEIVETQIGENLALRQINLRISGDAKKQLDVLAAKEQTTRQALIIEAINNLFVQKNLPPIA